MSASNTIRCASVLMFIASCDGSADTKPAAADAPSSTEGTRYPVPEADDLPLTGADGAPPNLRGCLNRNLYFNGPHSVSTTESVSVTKYDDTFNSIENKDWVYTVEEVTPEGVAKVNVEEKMGSSNGTGYTSSTSVSLRGFSTSTVATTAGAPPPAVFEYDLAPGESVTQDLSTPDLEIKRVYTYMGREDITVAGQLVKACRVNSVVTIPSELPQFRTSSRISTWYGVGTGLELRSDSLGVPDSIDKSRTLRDLTNAVINGARIH